MQTCMVFGQPSLSKQTLGTCAPPLLQRRQLLTSKLSPGFTARNKRLSQLTASGVVLILEFMQDGLPETNEFSETCGVCDLPADAKLF